MRKAIKIVTLGVILILAMTPALAMRVISDTYDPSTGRGVCLVELEPWRYALVTYVDADGSESFTHGRDKVLAIKFFSVSRKTQDVPIQEYDQRSEFDE